MKYAILKYWHWSNHCQGLDPLIQKFYTGFHYYPVMSEHIVLLRAILNTLFWLKELLSYWTLSIIQILNN
jgi:hypothetical protein